MASRNASQHAARFAVLRRDEHQRPRAGAGTRACLVNLCRRQPGHAVCEQVEPRAAGYRQRLGWEPALVAQVLRRVLVEEQRQGRVWETAVVAVLGVGSHLVRLVQVVQPVTVDEAVLQADRGDAAPAALEDDRAAPPAGLGVGDDDARAARVERGGSFVHRAGRPRPLQQRDARQLFADDRPAVAADV